MPGPIEGLPPPSLIDVAALLVVALGAVQGLFRGLSGELARMISVVAALFLGLLFCQPVGAWMLSHSRLEGRPAFALAFVTMTLGVIVFMIVVRYGLQRIMKIVVEPGAERVGGVVAGIIRASVFVVIVFAALNLAPHEYLNRKFGEQSLVGTALMRSLPHIQRLVDELGVLHGERDDDTEPESAGGRTDAGKG